MAALRSFLTRLLTLVLAFSCISAQAQRIAEFSAGSGFTDPMDIVTGPDGNVWFTEYAADGPAIAKITPLGALTEYSLPFGSSVAFITVGPDGNLWFTEPLASLSDRIGRLTPSGALTEFPTDSNSSSGAGGIVSGADGNLWFTEVDAGTIGRTNLSGIVSHFPIPTPNSSPVNITLGPDGNLWFTEETANQIGRISYEGTVTEFSRGITPNASPLGITTGADGNIWFTEAIGDRIARITPQGVVTEFPIASGSNPVGITSGPDGNIWFAESQGHRVGRITPNGFITEFSQGISAGFRPTYITTGPDGALWFTEQAAFSGQIGRLKVSKAPKLAMVFVPSTVLIGGSTSLQFTITNPNDTQALSGIEFVDVLPAGVEVSAPNALVGTCSGGTISAAGATIALTGATLPANGSCTLSVGVIGTSLGNKNDVVASLTSIESGAGPGAQANLAIVSEAIPVPSLTLWGKAFVLCGLTGLAARYRTFIMQWHVA